MLKKSTGCALGLFTGTILRFIVLVGQFLVTLIAKLLIVFGLWVPLIYAGIGGILYLATDFNPFDFSLYGTLYLSGAVATILCSLIISVKNIILKPAKSVVEGYKHPIWQHGKDEDGEALPSEKSLKGLALIKESKRAEKLAPPRISSYDRRERKKSEREVFSPQNNLSSPELPDFIPPLTNEMPKIYFSAVEPDTLIHQYSDRFEIYRFENNRKVLDRIEYR